MEDGAKTGAPVELMVSDIFDGVQFGPQLAKALARFFYEHFPNSVVGDFSISGSLKIGTDLNVVGSYKANGTAGISGSLTIPPLTSGGTNGSLTFKNGIITAVTQPT